MAITYVGAGALSFGNGTAANPVAPTGTQAGDLLIVMAGSDNQTILPPSSSTPASGFLSWTQVGNQALQGVGTGTTAARLGVYYRYATGSAEPSASLGNTGTTTMGRMFAVRGVDRADPIIYATTSSSALAGAQNFSCSFQAIDRSFIAFCLQTGRDANSTNAFAFTANASLQNTTERIDEVVNTGNGGGFALWTADVTSSVNPGLFNITKVTAFTDGISMMALALRPKNRVVLTF